jgi:phenylacetate-coenzyme A ligase PaaK-like adenylate-forming protein
MYETHIKYSVEGGESWRLERLASVEKAVGHACGLTHLYGFTDTKGILHVTWTCRPTDEERKAAEGAWLGCNEAAVFHHWPTGNMQVDL